MDLTIHVKVELVETPALINCCTAFCQAVERCTEILAASDRDLSFEVEKTVPVKVAEPKKEPAPVGPAKAEAPAEAPEKAAELPKSAEPKKYNLEDFRAACTPLLTADASIGAKIKDIINGFGVNALPDIPEEKYPELAEKLRELGAAL